ncbi:MAG: hypothetical protein HY902_06615 [Deltaproteobacteria bacterium]|nr:hypothetical protein [Deltaproteobacteria bacterium]
MLSPHFDQVDVFERDSLPIGPTNRPLLPQGPFVHVLLASGQRLFDRWFPGLQKRMDQLGAPYLDWAADTALFHCGAWMPRFASNLLVRPSTRACLEFALRSELAAVPGVAIHERTRAVGLVGEPGGAVTAIRVQTQDPVSLRWGSERTEVADLVVEALGRASQAGRWLGDLGHGVPSSTEIRPATSYATRIYQPADRPFPWRCLYLMAHGVAQPKAGLIWPLEGGRWGVNLFAYNGLRPPGEDEFLDFAGTLVRPDLAEALRDAVPLTPVRTFSVTANRRVHFESNPSWPRGLVVLGDASCAPNPVFGQGMSLAAMGVACLEDELRSGLDERRFQVRLGKLQQGAWLMCSIEDLRWPSTTGSLPVWTKLAATRWTDRVHSAAQRDLTLCRSLGDVIHLLQPPTSLLRPDRAVRVAVAPFRPKIARRGSRAG